MPCYTPDWRDDRHSRELRRQWEQFRHNSEVAEMLCAVIRTAIRDEIMTKEELVYYHKDLPQWWKEHKQRDIKRKRSK